MYKKFLQTSGLVLGITLCLIAAQLTPSPGINEIVNDDINQWSTLVRIRAYCKSETHSVSFPWSVGVWEVMPQNTSRPVQLTFADQQQLWHFYNVRDQGEKGPLTEQYQVFIELKKNVPLDTSDDNADIKAMIYEGTNFNSLMQWLKSKETYTLSSVIQKTSCHK